MAVVTYKAATAGFSVKSVKPVICPSHTVRQVVPVLAVFSLVMVTFVEAVENNSSLTIHVLPSAVFTQYDFSTFTCRIREVE